MPLFEYQCARCGAICETLVLCSKNPQPKCPKCGSSKMEQIFSTFTSRSEGGPTSSGASKSCGNSRFT